MSSTLYTTLHLTKDEFVKQLQECFDLDLGLPEIAKKFKTSSTTIWNWSNRLGIKRTRAATLRNKEWLTQKYSVDLLSMAEIATLIGVTYQAVDWWLTAHNIPRRPTTEIQRIASERYRLYTNLHTDKSFQSRGYCGWYKDIFYYRSINEVVWYMLNEGKFYSIRNEPFVYKNYKPDFLVNNNLVIEIKGRRTDDIEKIYRVRQNQLNQIGYDFQIIYVQQDFPKEYELVKTYVRKNGAIPGHGYPIVKNLLA